MLETDYRASRLCRVLGNPTAYKILKLLSRSKKHPSAIAKTIKLSKTTVSKVLVFLKLADLVRYDTLRRGRVYWLKDRSVFKLIKVLENFVDKARDIKW